MLFTPAVGRPFGTWGRLTAKPSVETLGYSRMSLRDKHRRPGQRDFRKALCPKLRFQTFVGTFVEIPIGNWDDKDRGKVFRSPGFWDRL